ncbi:MAG: peptidase M28, partial [Candidatus Sulfotelmatobacter sp.]
MKARLAASMCLVCFFLSFSLNLYAQEASDRAAVEVATKTIRAEQIRAHIRFLADSLLQGREPGTPGYDIAARYVATELE